MRPQHPIEALINHVFCCLLLMKYFFEVGILSVWTLVLVRRMSNVEVTTKLVTHEIPISSPGRNWSPWSHPFPPLFPQKTSALWKPEQCCKTQGKFGFERK